MKFRNDFQNIQNIVTKILQIHNKIKRKKKSHNLSAIRNCVVACLYCMLPNGVSSQLAFIPMQIHPGIAPAIPIPQALLFAHQLRLTQSCIIYSRC